MRTESATGGPASAVQAAAPSPAVPAAAPTHRLGRAALLGAAALLVAGLFGQRFYELFLDWKDDPTYSHGFLVPLVSAWFAWRAYRRQGPPRAGDLAPGLVWLVGGCLVHLVAVVVWFPPVDFVALGAVLYGLALLAGGRAWANGFAFPILFLFFMFPLPAALTNAVAVWLQGVVAFLAANVLSFFTPVHQEGYFLKLPGHQLEVGEACSGLRQLVAFAALGCIVFHVARRGRLYSLLLLLSTPVVAVAANLLRVLLMAVVVMTAGPQWIAEPYHTGLGLLTMAVGLGLFAAVGWWLARLLPAPAPNKEGPGAAVEDRAAGGAVARPVAVGVACLGGALLAQFALLAHVTAGAPAETAPLTRETLGPFPEEFPPDPVSQGAWKGVNVDPATLPPSTREYYDAADARLCRAYTHEGRPPACELWAVGFNDGTDRKHHPRICYLALGRAEDRAGYAVVDAGDGEPPIERFCYDGPAGPSFVFYWHYTLDPTPAGASPFQALYQTLRERRPSLTVEVFTAARTAAELDEAAAFVRGADRELRKLLPPGARRGSDALPIRNTTAPRNQ
jgi:exosortase